MQSRLEFSTLVALAFVGATWPPLHPLVARSAEATGPAPFGCEASLAPRATPRVNVADVPEIVPVSMTAPSSRPLRDELDAAHRALVRNDRPQFDAHLRAVRARLADYPAGAERSRAEEVLWALNDAAVLWDAQFQSPFFDEASDAYARASRYAGYTEAMRRSLLTDDSDRRFFPAAESRDFVARVAAERLQRLGVRALAPPARVARAETTAPAAKPAPLGVASSTTAHPNSRASSSPTPRRSTTIASTKPGKPAAVAKSAPSSSPDPSERTAPPASAAPAPAAPPAFAPISQPGADAPASPVTEVPPPSAAGAEPEATPAVARESTDATTTTAAPAPPEPAPAAPPAERRSVIVPAMLILIGLGVLIVLFRASK